MFVYNKVLNHGRFAPAISSPNKNKLTDISSPSIIKVGHLVAGSSYYRRCCRRPGGQMSCHNNRRGRNVHGLAFLKGTKRPFT